MIRRSFTYALILVLVSAFMRSNSDLPKIFVIGDSISIHYGPYLKQALSGFFAYDRKRDKGEALEDLDNPIGANGGDSQMVLDYLRELQFDRNFKTDYLLLNCGLHDIKRKSPKDSPQICLKKYRKNLLDIIKTAKNMKVKLIWVKSTPVIDSIHNTRVPFFRFSQDVTDYNSVADSIMKASGIPVIDLYLFTSKFIPKGYIDHVHYKEEIRREQANFIAGSLTAMVNCNKKHE